MTLNMFPDNWREKFDRYFGVAALLATLLGIFMLFFFVDDPVRFVLSWVLAALFGGAAIGVVVIVVHALFR